MDKLESIRSCFLALFLTIISSLSQGQGLNIHSGASLVNTGSIVLKGNWINDGSFSDNSGIIVFSGGVQTIGGTTPSAFNNITVSTGSNTSVIAAGQTLSKVLLSNGNLDGGGFLTLLSTAANTALIDGSGTGQVTGNIIMQRYLSDGGYKYFSSPFSDATVNQFTEEVDLTATFPRFYGYNEDDNATGWFTYTGTASPLNPMAGYAANFGDLATITTVNVTGTVNNGPYSRTLHNNNHIYTQGFNLVGNPYPSPIDWDAATGWTKTNIDAALYFFKSGGADIYSGTYYYYVSPGVSTGGASGIIPSMQAFFVHVTDGAFPVTGTLAMNNSVRNINQSHTFIKSDFINATPLIKLSAAFSDKPLSDDPAIIYFHEKGTGGFDNRLDAYKLINTDAGTPNLYIISEDGAKLAINALPLIEDSLQVIPLGIKIDRQGQINFNLKEANNLQPGIKVCLHDKATGTDRILDSYKSYSINLDAGEYNDRFSIRFLTNEKNIPENWPGQSLLNAYVFQGKLIADIFLLSGNSGTIILNNLSGQIIFRKDIKTLGYHEFDIAQKTGVYIVSFLTGNLRVSKKIFILNQ